MPLPKNCRSKHKGKHSLCGRHEMELENGCIQIERVREHCDRCIFLKDHVDGCFDMRCVKLQVSFIENKMKVVRTTRVEE